MRKNGKGTLWYPALGILARWSLTSQRTTIQGFRWADASTTKYRSTDAFYGTSGASTS